MLRSLPNLLMLALLLGGLSCTSLQKMVDEGRYDQALATAQRKLSGKSKKKAKYVALLEDAFAKANQRDLQQVDWLRGQGREEDWLTILDIYEDMRARQDALRPLLPLYDDQGRMARFNFVNTVMLEREARERSAAFLYNRALSQLDQARKGDKHAARQAYYDLEDVYSLLDSYQDVRDLQQEALDLGTVVLGYRWVNVSNMVFPFSLAREMEALELYRLSDTWNVFHNTMDPNVDYDYELVLEVQSVQLSPERITEREFQKTREIEDGETYLLDDDGNVAKDSLGDDIKVPLVKEVSAWVLERRQFKQAQLETTLVLIDRRTGQVVDRTPMVAEAVFEHYASTYRGDKRALSEEDCRYLDNRRIPFPANEQMIQDAFRALRPKIHKRASRIKHLI